MDVLIAFLYAILVFVATSVGSITGNGGGIVIKPVMDMIGTFDVSEIAILTSVTVLAMSSVSVIRQTKTRKHATYKKISKLRYFLLIIGGVAGGLGGQFLFSFLTNGSNEALVKIVQNAVFVAMIVFGFVYMSTKDKWGFQLQAPIAFLISGILLGAISSFLGIGGGTLNTAVFMMLFGINIKESAYCSLSIVLPAQITKLITIAVQGGFAVLNNALIIMTLCLMAAGGIAGGFFGSKVSSKISDNQATICFYSLQSVILCITIINIVRFSMLYFA